MGLLADGEAGEIVATGAVDVFCASRAEDLGLRVGRRVEVVANGTGPVLVKVDGARIAVDRGVAMRVKVAV